MKRLPVLFIGHGSPMNALYHNAFTEKLERLGRQIEKPKAVLCVSAHWLTAGTWITSMEHPKTIHDFYGFPKDLNETTYPAPGSPAVADMIQQAVKEVSVHLDDGAWGLDHGTWSVLKHMYPKADVPIVQLSIDMGEPGEFHLALGKELKSLRDQGILIIGSGNIVHNLRKIDFEREVKPFPWAQSFDRWVHEKLENRNYLALATEYTQAEFGTMAVPTPDHYFPMLYVLGASDDGDQIKTEYEGIEHGSISMRTFILEPKNV